MVMTLKEKDQQLITTQFAESAARLDQLEGMLGSGPYALGSNFTVADCALAPLMLYAQLTLQLLGKKLFSDDRLKLAAWWTAVHRKWSPRPVWRGDAIAGSTFVPSAAACDRSLDPSSICASAVAARSQNENGRRDNGRSGAVRDDSAGTRLGGATGRALLVFVSALIVVASAGAFPASASFGFITKWGSRGTGEGQFVDPNGLAIDLCLAKTPSARLRLPLPTRIGDEGRRSGAWR